MWIHLNIYIIIFNSFCVFFLEHFDFFKMFSLPSVMSDMVFHKKSELPFFWPNKTKDRQKVSSFYQVRITNPYGNFSNQINLKGSSVFRKSKFCGGLQYWLYNSKYTSRSCTSLEHSFSFYKYSYQVRP